MERGGPEVTEGLSPRIRSYSRMLTWPKVMEERCLRRLEEEPRWRDSWRVREVMMERMGLDSIEEASARMRMVGAEPREMMEEEDRLRLAMVWEPVVLRRRESSVLDVLLEGRGLENILWSEALRDAGGVDAGEAVAVDGLASGSICTVAGLIMGASVSIGLEPPCLEEQLPEHSDSAVLTPAACSPARGGMNMNLRDMYLRPPFNDG